MVYYIKVTEEFIRKNAATKTLFRKTSRACPQIFRGDAFAKAPPRTPPQNQQRASRAWKPTSLLRPSSTFRVTRRLFNCVKTVTTFSPFSSAGLPDEN